MTIIRLNWRGREEEVTLAEVVVKETTTGCDHGTGRLETIERELSKTRDILARLIDVIADKNILPKADLETIIFGYETGELTKES
jgi:hypothetical protein